MNNIAKSQIKVDGKDVHLSMPFAKVDKESRLVSGWATLDNVDTQGDVVLAEASASAFARARGNIREMHQPIAAGRIVDFREEEFYADSKFYRGIFVTAYISVGAEDTWQKVLDGTLTGFSIGGEVNEYSDEFVEEYGRTIRFIKDYDLTELSLVDNPANQLANVFSIVKSASGGKMMKGIIADTFVENVFICSNDETVIIKDTNGESCPVCDSPMTNAGWFESNANRLEEVDNIVNKFWASKETEDADTSISEGGVEMGVQKSDKVEETAAEQPEVEENETDEQAGDVDEVGEDEEVAAEDVQEVEDSEAEIAKRIDDLHEAVKDSLNKTREETRESVAELEEKIVEATESFLEKASEIETKMNSLGESISAQKARLADMESRITKMNDADAIRKSADVEHVAVSNVQGNTAWNGAFSGRRSSFSVDDL